MTTRDVCADECVRIVADAQLMNVNSDQLVVQQGDSADWLVQGPVSCASVISPSVSFESVK